VHGRPAQKFGDEEVWLVDWFRGRNETLVSTPIEQIVTADYFESQFVDSFGVIQLIEDVEQRFKLRFDERDFQDRRFSTVVGLAEIIRIRRAT
jgi:acyl carrier protein